MQGVESRKNAESCGKKMPKAENYGKKEKKLRKNSGKKPRNHELSLIGASGVFFDVGRRGVVDGRL